MVYRGGPPEGGGPEPRVVSISRSAGRQELRIAIEIPQAASAVEVLKSADGGKTWDNDPQYRYQPYEKMLLSDPQIVYQGSLGSFRRSTDGGRNWQEPDFLVDGSSRKQFLRRTVGPEGSRLQIILLAIQPNDPKTIYCSFGAQVKSSAGYRLYPVPGVYVSHDAGDRWSIFSKELSADTPLGISARNPKIIMARMTQGLVRSSDGGKEWQPVGQQAQLEERARSEPRDTMLQKTNERAGDVLNKDPDVLKLGISEIEFDPTNSNVIYLVSNKGLYRSLDGGNSWCLLDVGNLMLGNVKSLFFDPDRSSTIYVGTLDRILVSNDRGCHFHQIYLWQRPR